MANALILIVLTLATTIFFVYSLKTFLKTYHQAKEATKEFERMEANKCKGPHKWVEMEIKGSKNLVCEKCCYCPSYESFVRESYVRAFLYEQEYEKVLEENLTELSTQYNLNIEDLKELNSKINKISLDFSKAYIEKYLGISKEKEEE